MKDDIRRAFELLAEMPDEPDWPKNSKGWPKLLCYPGEADRLIACGLLTEDDIIRIQMIPTEASK